MFFCVLDKNIFPLSQNEFLVEKIEGYKIDKHTLSNG